MRVEEEVQTNETMQDLNGTTEELEKTRRELDEMTQTMLSIEEGTCRKNCLKTATRSRVKK